MRPTLTDAVRTAQADASEVEGRLRESRGGGAARLPGARLMASGLPQRQWNGGDVIDSAALDVDAVRAWYAARSVPWGLRVPAGVAFPHGRRLLSKRSMGLRLDHRLDTVGGPAALRRAGPADLDLYARIDAVAFDEDPVATRAWIEPLVGTSRALPLIAELDGEPVGVAYGLRSDGDAGPAVGLFGVGVLAGARRRGVASGLGAALLSWGAGHGARLAQLSPDTDAAAAVYAALGFVEVEGVDIYVDV